MVVGEAGVGGSMVQVGPGVGGAVAQLAPLLVGGPVTQLVRHLESIFGGLVVVLSSEIIKKMLYCCLRKHYPLSQNTTVNLNNYHTWKYFLIKKITLLCGATEHCFICTSSGDS